MSAILKFYLVIYVITFCTLYDNNSINNNIFLVCFLGPGAYQHRDAMSKKGGLMIMKDKRFKELKSDGPGPGSYEVWSFAHNLLNFEN